jgi:hypothetical protein
MRFGGLAGWSAVLLGCGCAGGPVTRAALRPGGEVVACQSGARAMDPVHCPESVLVVELVRPSEGPVVLRTHRDRLLREGSDGDGACDLFIRPRGNAVGQDTQRPPGPGMHLPDPKTSPWIAWLRNRTGTPDLKVRTLVEVDLDGDGRRELVFESNDPEDDRLPEDGPRKTHALLGVVSGGSVFYFVEQRLKLGTQNAVDEVEHVTLEGFTDLDGDGRLELVVYRALYEGYRAQVVAFDGVGFRVLGERRCFV